MKEICTSAILLAGSDHTETFSGKNKKFLLNIGGNPIIQNILREIEKSKIEQICVVGDEKEIKPFLKNKQKKYSFVNPTNSLSKNILAGLNQQIQETTINRTLVLATDLPFLSTSTINWLASIEDQNSEGAIIPIVTREKMLRLSTFYKTYYWPMTEDPFKWGDGANINAHRVGDNLSNFMDKYRNDWSKSKMKTVAKRLKLSAKVDFELVNLLVQNYLSKFVQQYLNVENSIPFSKNFNIVDYERILAKISGIKISMAKSPNIDLALDVDNQWRQEFFDKRYDEIKLIIRSAEVGFSIIY